MATAPAHLIDTLSGISLFADVGAAELSSIAHAVEERRYGDGIEARPLLWLELKDDAVGLRCVLADEPTR